MTPDLIRRADATTRTEQRFRWKPLDWKAGRHCAAMLHFHLKAMGHKPPPLPRLRGPVAARRELDRRGAATMAEVVDAMGFVRIAPAMMRTGDVAFKSSPDGLGGILICVGPHKLMGWFAENPETGGAMVVMDMSFDQVDTGWRL